MLDRNKMHEQQKAREYLKKDHMDEDTRDYHRNSRAELIGKVEKLLTALGKDGRQCVLYKLCKASQSSTQQGTFLEELLRIIFTLPKGTQFTKDEHQEYDKAHTSTENCDKFYPGCNHYT
ncbi:unnamed protein product [Diatraea saccharalis]|uniref:Uncharacterized protein n=1 Tax=Diatraea saccharalis TaxID=40085 RepID=A0A9N9R778_9NEOP|nr:unnamed protein product [Diatraea saccharalis]